MKSVMLAESRGVTMSPCQDLAQTHWPSLAGHKLDETNVLRRLTDERERRGEEKRGELVPRKSVENKFLTLHIIDLPARS